MSKKLTLEEFVKRANKVHKQKYNYSQSKYISSDHKISITCPKHGPFSLLPFDHLYGVGCTKCSNRYKRNTKEFIEEAKKVHDNKYDYSVTKYINKNTHINIKCKKHGIFKQLPADHLNGCGCSICSNRIRKTTKTFISQASKKHGNTYDYSKVNYINNHTDIIIICKFHGDFLQQPNTHLLGAGCAKCYHLSQRKTTEQFIKDCKKIHGNRYDYSLVQYTHSLNKVKIICKEHGIFLQQADIHVRGSGCQKCLEPKGERIIKEWLIKEKIEFVPQKMFNGCRSSKGRMLPFDFYFPLYNMLIEFDGLQHHQPFSYFGGKENLEEIKRRDKIKNEFCKEQNIKLIRIPYSKIRHLNEELSSIFKSNHSIM